MRPYQGGLGAITRVRFFGGTTFDYDGSFRERVCELAMPGSVRAGILRVRVRERSLDGCDVVNPTIRMKENSRCT